MVPHQLPEPTLYFPGTDQPGLGSIGCSGQHVDLLWAGLSQLWALLTISRLVEHPHPHPPHLPHMLISVLSGVAGWCKEHILLNTEFKESFTFYSFVELWSCFLITGINTYDSTTVCEVWV